VASKGIPAKLTEARIVLDKIAPINIEEARHAVDKIVVEVIEDKEVDNLVPRVQVKVLRAAMVRHRSHRLEIVRHVISVIVVPVTTALATACRV
jgi:hypothetical protein